MTKTVVKTSAVKERPVKHVERYFEGTGRRKTAIARVRIVKGGGSILVNGRDFKTYFPVVVLQQMAAAPLAALKSSDKFDVSARVCGGGTKAQAEAVRHGIARALLGINETFKKPLRRAGYLTRDPRMVERKKYGKKKARRSPQWKKR